jgi:archaellin
MNGNPGACAKLTIDGTADWTAGNTTNVWRVGISPEATVVAGDTQGYTAHYPLIPFSEKVYYNCDVSPGTLRTRGTDYTIDYDTGVITFSAALVVADLAVCADYSWYKVTNIIAALANSAGGQPVDLTPGITILGFLDKDTDISSLTDYTLTKLGNADADNLLEGGEIIEVNVPTCADRGTANGTVLTVNMAGTCTLSGDLNYGLTNYDIFTLYTKTQGGAVLRIERTVPGNINNVIDLG